MISSFCDLTKTAAWLTAWGGNLSQACSLGITPRCLLLSSTCDSRGQQNWSELPKGFRKLFPPIITVIHPRIFLPGQTREPILMSSPREDFLSHIWLFLSLFLKGKKHYHLVKSRVSVTHCIGPAAQPEY